MDAAIATETEKTDPTEGQVEVEGLRLTLPRKFQPIVVGPHIAILNGEDGKPVIKEEKLLGQGVEADLFRLTVLACSVKATILSGRSSLPEYEFGFTQILELRKCDDPEMERRKLDGYSSVIPYHSDMVLGRQQQVESNFSTADKRADRIGRRYVLTR